MSQDWERSYDFKQQDLEQLSELVEPVFGERRVVSAQPLSAGNINTNYKIEVEDEPEPFVLRLYERGATVCRQERELYELVHGRVPVPELLYADPDSSQPYSLSRWVEGDGLGVALSKAGAAQADELGYSVGATLARIGSFQFERPGFFGPGLQIYQPFGTTPQFFLGFIENCLFQKGADARLGPALADRLWQFVRDQIGYIEAIAHERRLVHSDYNATNLLMREGKVVAVLDWEWSHAGTPLTDIAILLRFSDRLPAAFEPAFLRGYAEEGGLLPPEWRRTYRLLDLMNLCEFLTRPDRGDTRNQDCLNLIKHTIENWANL